MTWPFLGQFNHLGGIDMMLSLATTELDQLLIHNIGHYLWGIPKVNVTTGSNNAF